ncbi:MAG: hypothetical protein HRU02_05470 [Myxococcales bacterium]|nr:hypothetical protein [Myxococcales bacterium]
MRFLWLLVGCLAVAGWVHAELRVWVDEAGITHLSNRAEAGVGFTPTKAVLGDLWEGPLDAAGRSVGSGNGRERERSQRLLRAAVADLQRGETLRAAEVLESILRDRPADAEAHWYLALLERQRGRYESAGRHLEAFLASAGDDMAGWRASARQRLAQLADERRLADAKLLAEGSEWQSGSSEHFVIRFDQQLAAASPDYGDRVTRYLEEAWRAVDQRIGARSGERMEVLLYGRAAYDRAHADRFSFRTVGFYDGRVHVVSAAHPAGELRALLFHEYAHAVFRQRTGGDQPYWFNEGLAELVERASRRQPRLSRSERSQLDRRIDAGNWIPLSRLAPSFSNLDDDEARIAYLEATAAVSWIEDHSRPEQRAALLARLGEGVRDDAALRETLGRDTAFIDAAVREWIRSEFPPQLGGPPAASR